MTPSADESAIILTNKLRNKEPFVFVKFGDCTLWWMAGKPVQSANGEVYRPGIDKELREAASTLNSLPHVYFGDQLTCSSGPYLEKEQHQLVRWTPNAWTRDSRWVHFETLLLHRLTPELLEFYRVLKADPRVKGVISGRRLWDASKMLGEIEPGMWFTVDQNNAHIETSETISLVASFEWEILLLAAGHGSKLIAAALASKFPYRTIIELGSALDPLFVGRTRSEQVSTGDAREYFKELTDAERLVCKESGNVEETAEGAQETDAPQNYRVG